MGTNKNNNKGFCLLTERTKTKRMSPLPREMMFDENAPEPLTKGNVDKALHVLRNRETINKDLMDDPSVVVGCRVRAIRDQDGVFEQGQRGVITDVKLNFPFLHKASVYITFDNVEGHCPLCRTVKLYTRDILKYVKPDIGCIQVSIVEVRLPEFGLPPLSPKRKEACQ